MSKTSSFCFLFSTLSALALGACNNDSEDSDVEACVSTASTGLRPIADDRSERFLGKVQEDTARCRGGDKAVASRDTPWVDWSNYWATGDISTESDGREAITSLGEHLFPNGRGIDGSLLDLEYQRIELIKFNLFDNYTYQTYIQGSGRRSWLDCSCMAGDASGRYGPQLRGSRWQRTAIVSGRAYSL